MDNSERQSIGTVRTFFLELDRLNLDKPSDEIYYFRGHADLEGYKLIPSIYRDLDFIENEHRMFREIIMRCPNDFSNNMTAFEKLVKMQHYKLPTRLLDLTGNPLVALFFAVYKEPKKDGEVLIFKVPKNKIKYYDSDTVSILSNIAKLNEDFCIKKIKGGSIEIFNSDDNVKYLLHEIKEDKPYFEPNIEAEDLESVLCVKPKLDNPRIIKQDGAFFLYGIQDEKKNPAIIPDSYKVTTEFDRLIIRKETKRAISQQLSTLGLNRATLFPEIDYVSEYLKEIFMNESDNEFKRTN